MESPQLALPVVFSTVTKSHSFPLPAHPAQGLNESASLPGKEGLTMPCIPFSLIPPVGKGLEPGRTLEVSGYAAVTGTSHPGTTGKDGRTFPSGGCLLETGGCVAHGVGKAQAGNSVDLMPCVILPR